MSRSTAIEKRVRALRKDAALRRAEGVLLAEGTRLAEEALRAGMPVDTALVSPALSAGGAGRRLLERLWDRASAVVELGDDRLAALQDARSPQPVLLVVRRPEPALGAALAGRGGVPLVVVAWGVQDPGNLGSIVRTADAAGATGCVAVGGADPTHPRAVRGTMGSIFRLPVARSEEKGLLDRLATAGLRRVGAAARGSVPYVHHDWRPPTALLLGSEGGGLSTSLVEACDDAVGIPMRSGVESLSVGAAAAVLLFEAARQRGVSAG